MNHTILRIGLGFVCFLTAAVAGTPVRADSVVAADYTWDWTKGPNGEDRRELFYDIDPKCDEVPVNNTKPGNVGPVNLLHAINMAAYNWNVSFGNLPAGHRWGLTQYDPTNPNDPPPSINITCPKREHVVGLELPEDYDPYQPGVDGTPKDMDGLLGRFVRPVTGDFHVDKAEILLIQGVFFPNPLDPAHPRNVMIPWGVDNNRLNNGLMPPGPIDGFYDPIIVMMHEFGHALRLGHKGGPGIMWDNGSIMRESLVKGQHAINAGVFFRQPADIDVNAAARSAAYQPEPASLALFAIAVFGITHRRRGRCHSGRR